jgi:hypothetical protein
MCINRQAPCCVDRVRVEGRGIWKVAGMGTSKEIDLSTGYDVKCGLNARLQSARC